MKKRILKSAIILMAVSIIGISAGDVKADEEVIIIREASGDREGLQAVHISDEDLSLWRETVSEQYASGSADALVDEFLTCGSDYGYRDMSKRSNSAARQYAYQKLKVLCDDYTKSTQDANSISTGRGSYQAAGIIDLPGYRLSGYEMAEIYFTFRNDNPQYFWLSNNVVYSDSSLVALTYDEYQSGTVRKAALQEIIKTMQEVYRAGISAGDDNYHKTLKIHDTLIADIEYSHDVTIPISHSIAGAMTSAKSAVCEGYAKVMQLLMNCYHISNIYITGDAGGGHAWNMVRMNDGKYYWLDATWDDQEYEEVRHNYFLVGNQNFTDHMADVSTGIGTDFLYDLPAASDEDYVYDASLPDITKGDINADNYVTMVDLMMCLHHVSGRTELTGNAFLAADIDNDGIIKMGDLMRILHHVSGKSMLLCAP